MGQTLVQSSGYIGDLHRFTTFKTPVLSYDNAGAPIAMASSGVNEVNVIRVEDGSVLGLGTCLGSPLGALGNINPIQVDVLNNLSFFIAERDYIAEADAIDVDGTAVAGYELFRFSISCRSNIVPDGAYRIHKLDVDGTAMANLIKIQNDFAGGPALLAMAVAAGDNPAIGVKKNASFGPWPIIMWDATAPTTVKTGLTVAAQRSLDGGAFANCVNAVSEVGSGCYKHTLAAGDTNATKSVVVKYTSAGAVTAFLILLITP